jgi:hypothetical protein
MLNRNGNKAQQRAAASDLKILSIPADLWQEIVHHSLLAHSRPSETVEMILRDYYKLQAATRFKDPYLRKLRPVLVQLPPRPQDPQEPGPGPAGGRPVLVVLVIIAVGALIMFLTGRIPWPIF